MRICPIWKWRTLFKCIHKSFALAIVITTPNLKSIFVFLLLNAREQKKNTLNLDVRDNSWKSVFDTITWELFKWKIVEFKRFFSFQPTHLYRSHSEPVTVNLSFSTKIYLKKHTISKHFSNLFIFFFLFKSDRFYHCSPKKKTKKISSVAVVECGIWKVRQEVSSSIHMGWNAIWNKKPFPMLSHWRWSDPMKNNSHITTERTEKSRQ